MADSYRMRSALGGPGTRPWGHVLAAARYRHPGDVIRVVLADDRGLQPAENVVPLVRRDAVARYGPRLLGALNTVSARLTTGSLRALDAQVELRGENPRLVAQSWLRTQGLASMGGALH
jgi:hypothetical protein